ncbi:MAG TPA: hypothetical protein VF037_10270 [Gemmatimonadales bacterium]
MRSRPWKWTLLAAAAGFASAAIFSLVLHLDRYVFVAAWGVVALAVFVAFARAHRLTLRTQLSRHVLGGIVVGALAGAVLAWTVLRQPASAVPHGGRMGVDLLWLGVVYGTLDALVLSVLPVLAFYGARPAEELSTPAGRLRPAAMAIVGSIVVTAAYHLGFREFQGAALVGPIIGNTVVTLAYLVSGSALAPVIAHVAMHGAAVLHGAATTAQLPPHY